MIHLVFIDSHCSGNRTETKRFVLHLQLVFNVLLLPVYFVFFLIDCTDFVFCVRMWVTS